MRLLSVFKEISGEGGVVMYHWEFSPKERFREEGIFRKYSPTPREYSLQKKYIFI